MFCIGIRAGLLQHRRIDTSSVSRPMMSVMRHWLLKQSAVGGTESRLVRCVFRTTLRGSRLLTRASARTQASSSKFAAQRRERSAYTAPSKRATREDDAQSAAHELSAAHFAVSE